MVARRQTRALQQSKLSADNPALDDVTTLATLVVGERATPRDRGLQAHRIHRAKSPVPRGSACVLIVSVYVSVKLTVSLPSVAALSPLRLVVVGGRVDDVVVFRLPGNAPHCCPDHPPRRVGSDGHASSSTLPTEPNRSDRKEREGGVTNVIACQGHRV